MRNIAVPGLPPERRGLAPPDNEDASPNPERGKLDSASLHEAADGQPLGYVEACHRVGRNEHEHHTSQPG